MIDSFTCTVISFSVFLLAFSWSKVASPALKARTAINLTNKDGPVA